jgi:IclR family transcriptional regulator, KDG regulon repressor
LNIENYAAYRLSCQQRRKGFGRMTQDASSDGTVGKALDVLDMVAQANRPVRFSELLAQKTYPKATLYRFLQTLTNQGMLGYDEDRGTYSLGVRLVRLAHSAWQQSSLAPLARRYIDDLAAESGETIHLAQMDQGQVLYVDKRNATQPVEMFSSAGKVGPAYCTGVGKAMLAFMPDPAVQAAISRQSFHRFTPQTLDSAAKLLTELGAIRERGHAFDREEHEPGIICCAVPIRSRSGRVLGALSMTSTTSRTTLAALEAQSPRIKDTAAQIAAEAESWRFPEQN